MRNCCICGVDIYRGYFCRKCYFGFKDDILSNKTWVKFLRNFERKRRRSKRFIIIYLGDTYDIDNNHNLIYKGEARDGG